MYWVYILQNPTGRFYIGQTDNLSIRLANPKGALQGAAKGGTRQPEKSVNHTNKQ